jgi:hypothetical protein
MPRKSNKTIEERLIEIDGEIQQIEERKANLDVKIDTLQKKRDSILKEQRQEKLLTISDLLDSKGIDLDKAISFRNLIFLNKFVNRICNFLLFFNF